MSVFSYLGDVTEAGLQVFLDGAGLIPGLGRAVNVGQGLAHGAAGLGMSGLAHLNESIWDDPIDAGQWRERADEQVMEAGLYGARALAGEADEPLAIGELGHDFSALEARAAGASAEEAPLAMQLAAQALLLAREKDEEDAEPFYPPGFNGQPVSPDDRPPGTY